LNTLKILQNNWGNVILEMNEDIIYWEIKVIKHGGSGHLRIGIVNDNFDINNYPGSDANNSLSIYHTNVIQGFGGKSTNGVNWNTNDIIGVYFNRLNAVVRFYHNKQFITEIINIQNPNNWYPILCIHCDQDEIELIRNTTLPNGLINIQKGKLIII
jgi:hypothetical protein